MCAYALVFLPAGNCTLSLPFCQNSSCYNKIILSAWNSSNLLEMGMLKISAVFIWIKAKMTHLSTILAELWELGLRRWQCLGQWRNIGGSGERDRRIDSLMRLTGCLPRKSTLQCAARHFQLQRYIKGTARQCLDEGGHSGWAEAEHFPANCPPFLISLKAPMHFLHSTSWGARGTHHLGCGCRCRSPPPHFLISWCHAVCWGASVQLLNRIPKIVSQITLCSRNTPV